MRIKKVHVVLDMLGEVSCSKPPEYDPEICKNLLKWNNPSFFCKQ